MHFSPSILLSLVFLLPLSVARAEESGKHYPDGHGGEVYFPQGDISFADELVSFTVGDPDAGDASERPEETLGIPDFDAVSGTKYLTLGCGGELILAFTDNVLVDIAGPDLYIFEIGPNIEPTALAISPDGIVWTRVGKIEGGKAEIDIADYVPRGAAFRYVKLVDLKQACGGYPGADIDAVGAIGSATKISLDSAVLFDTGKYALKESATAALKEAFAEVENTPGTKLTVEGHTDNVGSDGDNQTLSRNRADAVAAFLVEEQGFAVDAVDTRAFGETRPIASNDTDEGRQKNRRVEITVVADPPERSGDDIAINILGIWETSEGLMELQQEGDKVVGVYADESRIVGKFTSETIFEGHWVEQHSNQACVTEIEGSLYWGAIRFEFETPARDNFTGTWQYCEDASTADSWDGKRVL